MRKLLLLAVLMVPLSAFAQQFGARASFEADYKIKKGLRGLLYNPGDPFYVSDCY